MVRHTVGNSTCILKNNNNNNNAKVLASQGFEARRFVFQWKYWDPRRSSSPQSTDWVSGTRVNIENSAISKEVDGRGPYRGGGGGGGGGGGWGYQLLERQSAASVCAWCSSNTP